MIDGGDIADELGKRLVTFASIPLHGTDKKIVWPNRDKPPEWARPYLVVEYETVSRTSRDVAGSGGTIQTGFMQVTVIWELGVFATGAQTLAEGIAAHFPKGWNASITGGTLVISKPAVAMDGFRDGTDWRVPVQIDYLAS